ncbi:MAG: hypothetical protein J6S58_05355 [Lentisphaeria bacterium]|nr:hypothetical protein [Lentisphaeria bacterium]
MVNNMLYGILTAMGTGLCWSCIGIVLSCCASRNLPLIPYSFLQAVLTGTAALFMVDFQKFDLHDFLILMLFVFTAGFLNSVGQKTVHRAMEQGNHAPAWAISQSALIIPFLTGIFLFQNRGSTGQWIGTVLIVSGILVPVLKEIKHISGYFVYALAAFLIFGAVQTLYGIPSQLSNFKDVAGFRSLAAACGGAAGWFLSAMCSKSSLRFNRKILLIACEMVLVQLVSLRLFFISLDTLSAASCGNIAFPLMTGANISGFAVYSIFIRREKTALLDKIGFCMVIAGLVFIAI